MCLFACGGVPYMAYGLLDIKIIKILKKHHDRAHDAFLTERLTFIICVSTNELFRWNEAPVIYLQK